MGIYLSVIYTFLGVVDIWEGINLWKAKGRHMKKIYQLIPDQSAAEQFARKQGVIIVITGVLLAAASWLIKDSRGFGIILLIFLILIGAMCYFNQAYTGKLWQNW